MTGDQDWADGPAPPEYNRHLDDAARRSGRSVSPNAPPRRDRSRSPMRIDNEKPPSRGRTDNGDHNPGNNLHVSNISSRAEDADLQELFSKHGRVQKAQLMRDPVTKELRGFGFVTMETAEEAETAMNALNGFDLLGKNIGVEKARRGRARTPTPGQYRGPPKRGEDRRYDPRGYGGSSRYEERDRGYERRDRRFEDRAPAGRDDRYGYAAPMRNDRDRYDDRDRRDHDRPRRDDREYDRRW